MKVGQVAGSKKGKVTPLFPDIASKALAKFKAEKFEGFDKVFYSDSGGRSKQKKGAPAPKSQGKK